MNQSIREENNPVYHTYHPEEPISTEQNEDNLHSYSHQNVLYTVGQEPKPTSCTSQPDIPTPEATHVYSVSDTTKAENSAMYAASGENEEDANAIESTGEEFEPKVMQADSAVVDNSDMEPYAVANMSDHENYLMNTTTACFGPQVHFEQFTNPVYNENIFQQASDDSSHDANVHVHEVRNPPNAEEHQEPVNRPDPQQASDDTRPDSDVHKVHNPPNVEELHATVTTRRTCFCVLSTCKNVGNRTASVRAYERATYGLRESNFTILTCNCCTDSARSTCVPRTVLASSVLTPHFPVDLLNDHAEHTCTLQVYQDDLTGDCQLVSKMPRKAQKKTTRQDPKKRAAEDTRAASDDEVNRRCTHLQRASTACTRQRSNRTEIVRCKHVQLTYHLRNVRCTQPLTARRVVQTTTVDGTNPPTLGTFGGTNPPILETTNGTNPLIIGTINGTNPPILRTIDGTNPPTLGTTDSTNPLTLGTTDSNNPPTLGTTNGPNPPTLGTTDSTNPPPLGTTDSTNPPTLGTTDGTNPPTLGTTDGTNPPTLGTTDSTNPPTLGTTDSTNPPTPWIIESTKPPDYQTQKACEGNTIRLTCAADELIVIDDAFYAEKKDRVTFGGAGRGPGKFQTAGGLAVSSTNEIFVTDVGNERIQVFSMKGSFLRSFSTGKKMKPYAISIGRHDTLWVVLNTSRPSAFTVHQYSKEGHVLSKCIFRDGLKIAGIAWHKLSDRIILSIERKRLRLLPDNAKTKITAGWVEVVEAVWFRPTYTLTQVPKFIKFGSTAGTFGQSVAVYEKGNIFITDNQNSTVQKYDKYGVYLSSFDSKAGDLFYPSGISVDRFGRVIVGDYRNSKLEMFTAEGKHIRTVAYVRYPYRVATGGEGQLVVSNESKFVTILLKY
ncbi:hypothetical protein Bbelb_216980 [Branchiostoma belcheri]|nr:hypothetical protein Bbelb_216980 [Branchiostoma belcheri]